MQNVLDVATNVEGGTVNASQISINGTVVVDGDGAFVGQPTTPQWSDIQNILRFCRWCETTTHNFPQVKSSITSNKVPSISTKIQPSMVNLFKEEQMQTPLPISPVWMKV